MINSETVKRLVVGLNRRISIFVFMGAVTLLSIYDPEGAEFFRDSALRGAEEYVKDKKLGKNYKIITNHPQYMKPSSTGDVYIKTTETMRREMLDTLAIFRTSIAPSLEQRMAHDLNNIYTELEKNKL